MSERTVVLGSNSFSGAQCVDFLLGAGAEVIGISRSVQPHPVFLPYVQRKEAEFRFYQLDLNRDLDRIMEVIRDFQPAYVLNFAAQSMVGESWLHPEHWFQTNAVAQVRLHDQLRTCGFLKKYVHVSTPEVYGNCEGALQENTRYNPSTPYAVSRAAADMSLMTFFRNYDFPVVLTRAANVYGPGQQLYRIIPKTVFGFLTGKKIPLHGGGRSVRSFIHIRDVVDGTWRCAQSGANGEIFHFSTSRNISIRALVGMIAAQMNISFADHTEETQDRPGKDASYLLDSSKARKILSWEDTISLEQGIEETIRWVKDNLEILKKQPLQYIHKP